MLIEAVTGWQAASSSTATRDHLTLVEGQQRLPWAGNDNDKYNVEKQANTMSRQIQTRCQYQHKHNVMASKKN